MASLTGLTLSMARAAETRLAVVFSGGHDTDPRDRGRPVNLVAAALGVTSEVFREAFSGVTPARRDGGPTREEARSNKAALMKVLSPHGVTNERLDEVSNYYRYRRERGEMWRNTAAQAEAVFENDVLKRIEIKEAGAGYSSPPVATIEGKKNLQLNVTLTFDKDLKKNGSIAKIEAAPAAK
ncbi:MAG: hypothetical protein ACAI35_01160 [Candidatus Methylacidiphilales bacterium]